MSEIFSDKEAKAEKIEDIQLPTPVSKGKMSLEEVIKKRRSKRSFEDKSLTLEQVSPSSLGSSRYY